MRHVGDVHPQPPMSAVEPLERNRVVEVAGVDRIDRDDRQAGQVEPAGRNRLVELLRLPPGLFENVVVETRPAG